MPEHARQPASERYQVPPPASPDHDRYSADPGDGDGSGVAAERAHQGVHRRRSSRAQARAVWLAAGLGLCLDGIAVAIAPDRPGFGQSLFWTALFVPFAVCATVLCAAQASPWVRQLTVAIIGLYPAIIYRMSSPIILGGFDEHLHERTLLDLLHGGGLFASNPQLQVGPYYPGLELFTGVATRLTGAPPIVSMALVVFLCRLLFVLAMYECALTVLRSPRGASFVVMFYAASQQFYFFNSQFSYETMALTLGMGGIYFLRRAQLATGPAARWLSGLAMLALVTTVMSHHLTSWLFLAFLLAWALVSRPRERKVVLRAALVMAIAVGVWSAAIASQLVGYLGPVFRAAFSELQSTVTGSTKGHTFSGSGGNTSPEWEKILLLFYAVCATSAALICGGILLRRAIRTRNPRVGLLALLTIAYPATLAAHFVPAASDVGDRSSTFLFIPLALSCALVISTSRRPRWLGAENLRSIRFTPVIIGLTLVYIGGVALGAGPGWGLLPGPYLVSAEARTQDPYTLAAVRWATAHVPAGSTIVADRIPADMMASVARLWPITEPKGRYEPAQLYFSSTWGLYQTDVVKGMSINYIYVDQRVALSFPLVGSYFYPGETGITGGTGVNITQQQLSRADINKFAHVPGLRVVYHLGPVTIYDTAGIGVASQRDGYTSVRSMGLGAVGDYLLGAMVVGLIFAVRRRLNLIPAIARGAGVLGTILALLSVTIIVGGVLFGLRCIPGPYFSLGAITAAAVIAVAVRWRGRGSSATPFERLPFLRHPDAVILLGVLAAMTGVALSIHTLWGLDVTQVYRLLEAVRT
jgi:hypothetical protein